MTTTGIAAADEGYPRAEAGRRTRVFGIDIDVLDQQGAVQRIAHGLNRPRDGDGPLRVVTVNVYHALLNRKPGPFQEAVADAGLVLADGMPLVWSSRLSAHALPERVTGADLILPVCREAARRGASIFVLGTTLPILARACRRLGELCPGLEIAGVYAPPFGFTADHALSEEALAMIASCRADVLFLALGAPKQEVWMHVHRARLRTKAVVCAGASFDFLAQAQRRAPRALQRSGLEWLWRLALSPRRLGRRYAAMLTILPSLFVEQCREFVRERSRDDAWRRRRRPSRASGQPEEPR